MVQRIRVGNIIIVQQWETDVCDGIASANNSNNRGRLRLISQLQVRSSNQGFGQVQKCFLLLAAANDAGFMDRHISKTRQDKTDNRLTACRLSKKRRDLVIRLITLNNI